MGGKRKCPTVVVGVGEKSALTDACRAQARVYSRYLIV